MDQEDNSSLHPDDSYSAARMRMEMDHQDQEQEDDNISIQAGDSYSNVRMVQETVIINTQCQSEEDISILSQFTEFYTAQEGPFPDQETETAICTQPGNADDTSTFYSAQGSLPVPDQETAICPQPAEDTLSTQSDDFYSAQDLAPDLDVPDNYSNKATLDSDSDCEQSVYHDALSLDTKVNPQGKYLLPVSPKATTNFSDDELPCGSKVSSSRSGIVTGDAGKENDQKGHESMELNNAKLIVDNYISIPQVTKHLDKENVVELQEEKQTMVFEGYTGDTEVEGLSSIPVTNCGVNVFKCMDHGSDYDMAESTFQNELDHIGKYDMVIDHSVEVDNVIESDDEGSSKLELPGLSKPNNDTNFDDSFEKAISYIGNDFWNESIAPENLPQQEELYHTVDGLENLVPGSELPEYPLDLSSTRGSGILPVGFGANFTFSSSGLGSQDFSAFGNPNIKHVLHLLDNEIEEAQGHSGSKSDGEKIIESKTGEGSKLKYPEFEAKDSVSQNLGGSSAPPSPLLSDTETDTDSSYEPSEPKTVSIQTECVISSTRSKRTQKFDSNARKRIKLELSIEIDDGRVVNVSVQNKGTTVILQPDEQSTGNIRPIVTVGTQIPKPIKTKRKTYPCGICGKPGFKSHQSRYYHMQTHEVIMCQVPGCEKRFSRYSTRENHMQTCHPNETKSDSEPESTVKSSLQSKSKLKSKSGTKPGNQAEKGLGPQATGNVHKDPYEYDSEDESIFGI